MRGARAGVLRPLRRTYPRGKRPGNTLDDRDARVRWKELQRLLGYFSHSMLTISSSNPNAFAGIFCSLEDAGYGRAVPIFC